MFVPPGISEDTLADPNNMISRMSSHGPSTFIGKSMKLRIEREKR